MVGAVGSKAGAAGLKWKCVCEHLCGVDEESWPSCGVNSLRQQVRDLCMRSDESNSSLMGMSGLMLMLSPAARGTSSISTMPNGHTPSLTEHMRVWQNTCISVVRRTLCAVMELGKEYAVC